MHRETSETTETTTAAGTTGGKVKQTIFPHMWIGIEGQCPVLEDEDTLRRRGEDPGGGPEITNLLVHV